MEYDKIKQLINDIGNSKLTSLDIEFPDGTKISAKKEITSKEPLKEKNEAVISNNIQSKEVVKTIDSNEEEGNVVKSPIVGTFYLKPSPTAKPYVELGKRVKKGDILCIIEAMKLMNEIECEYDGEISQIYVKDGEPVEYGKPLFRIS